jgi:hypothetical protein
MRRDLSELVDARYTTEGVLGQGGLAHACSIAPAVTAFHVSDAPDEIASHRACSSRWCRHAQTATQRQRHRHMPL